MAKKAPNPDLVDDDDDPLVGTADLHLFGVTYHSNHLRRLWQAGKFPKPFKGSDNRLNWRRSWIRRWQDERERQGGVK